MTDRDEARTILLDVMEESALEVASVIAAHRFDDQAVWNLMHGLDAVRRRGLDLVADRLDFDTACWHRLLALDVALYALWQDAAWLRLSIANFDNGNSRLRFFVQKNLAHKGFRSWPSANEVENSARARDLARTSLDDRSQTYRSLALKLVERLGPRVLLRLGYDARRRVQRGVGGQEQTMLPVASLTVHSEDVPRTPDHPRQT